MKCCVLGCTNHDHEGKFIGFLCNPCHAFVSGGIGGEHSQAFRNTKELTDKAVIAAKEELIKTLTESLNKGN
jgi:hypothetical protein